MDNQIIDTLERSLAHLIRVPATIFQSAVYVLLWDDRIVYVGQSDCPARRINQHQKTKRFNNAAMIPCSAEYKDELETALIKLWRPQYNIHDGKVICNRSSFHPAEVLRKLFSGFYSKNRLEYIEAEEQAKPETPQQTLPFQAA